MHAEASVAAPRYSRANPFPAKLLVNRSLSGPESAKDTRHFELDLTGWGLSFEVGDLLAPERRQDLTTYLWGMEVIDFLIEHPSAHFRPEEFVGLLTKLQPRLYSVASSLKAYPEQVHFIVDVVTYESHGRVRKGV